MEIFRAGFARRMLRQVHLWVGLGLGVLFVPLSLSGALLVFGGEVDRFLDPSRFAVSSGTVEQAAGVYLANAAAAAPGGRAVALRWPESDGAPVTVLLRGGAAEGAKDQIRVAYLDPPTGKVLGVADRRNSLVGIAHALHANLLIENFSGRQIVGWIGIGLFAMVATGLYMWWPRSAGLRRALRWRRGPDVNSNLHHMLGFWIAGPLAVVALTGVYLSFPQQVRAVIAVFADLTPQPPRQRTDLDPMRRPALDPQRVIELALQSGAGLQPLSLSPPTEQGKVWRVQASQAGGVPQTVLIDDATSAVTLPRPASSGDAFTVWLRRVHDATHHGPLWRIVAFLCGLAPTLFLVTGAIIWLRRRGPAASPFPERAKRPRELPASSSSNV